MRLTLTKQAEYALRILVLLALHEETDRAAGEAPAWHKAAAIAAAIAAAEVRPVFARALVPKYTGLRLDLERYVRYDNTDRAHTGPSPAAGRRTRSSARTPCGPADAQPSLHPRDRTI